MGWPSGIPPWQEADLQALSKSGQLSGVNPLVLAGIDQEESGFEVKGAGYNSAGYGGFFGLGTGPYPGGNQESVSSLEDPSETSFKHQAITAGAAFNSYLKQAGSEGYSGLQQTDRAETIYQEGGGTKGIESGGGVDVVNQALGSGTDSGGATTSGSAASGSSNTSAGSGSANAIKLDGIAGVMQSVNDLMNPPSIGTWATITSLGTANVTEVIELLVTRVVFTIGFLALAYVGVKQITGGGGSSNVIQIVEQQQRVARDNEATASKERNTNRRAEAAERVAATPKVSTKYNVKLSKSESDVYHHASAPSTAASQGSRARATTAAGELAEGALAI